MGPPRTCPPTCGRWAHTPEGGRSLRWQVGVWPADDMQRGEAAPHQDHSCGQGPLDPQDMPSGALPPPRLPHALLLLPPVLPPALTTHGPTGPHTSLASATPSISSQGRFRQEVVKDLTEVGHGPPFPGSGRFWGVWMAGRGVQVGERRISPGRPAAWTWLQGH